MFIGLLVYKLIRKPKNSKKVKSHKGESKKGQTISALRWYRFAINLSTHQPINHYVICAEL
jgi:hypothetical protein